MQLDGDAVQDISWPGLQALVETYKRRQLRAGAAAYLTVVMRPRKRRRFYTKGSKTGQPTLLYTGGGINAANKHGTGAEARGRLRGGPPSSVLIRGTTVLDKGFEDGAVHGN